MCGDADKVHSLTVSATHARLQRRPVLSWTSKPNGGIHAQLRCIGRICGRVISAENALPARALHSGQESFRPALHFAAFFTCSGLSQVVDAAFYVHSSACGAYPSSTVRVVSVCAQSRPLACIVTQAGCKEQWRVCDCKYEPK